MTHSRSFVIALSAVVALPAAALLNARTSSVEDSCAVADLKHRAELQNKLAGDCENMCKEIGAYPKCSCPNFVPPDATPNVMTWPELIDHMENLEDWGVTMVKENTKIATALAQSKPEVSLVGLSSSEKACMAE